MIYIWTTHAHTHTHTHRPICGGSSELPSPSNKDKRNIDTCIAIVGIPSNGTIAIRKYCIPKAQGKAVRGAPTETWFIWFSEEWSDTLVNVEFLDTVSADTVVVLRDNKGRSLDTGPLEHFVTVHSRKIQRNTALFDLIYSTSQNRIDRQMLVKMSSEIDGLDSRNTQVPHVIKLYDSGDFLPAELHVFGRHACILPFSKLLRES
jgi:hypothetical protein